MVNEKQDNIPNVLCIVHIGSYHIFMKMKKYIDNLVLAKYDEYNLDIYFNIIDSMRQEHITSIKKIYPEERIEVRTAQNLAGTFPMVYFCRINFSDIGYLHN